MDKAPKCQVCDRPARWGWYTTPRCEHHRLIEQGGHRVKAPTRMLGIGVPEDARPGDLVVGNRGAAAIVIQPPSQWGGLCGCLCLEYAGNVDRDFRLSIGRRRIYDFRGGT